MSLVNYEELKKEVIGTSMAKTFCKTSYEKSKYDEY